jgi:hypothetical protein
MTPTIRILAIAASLLAGGVASYAQQQNTAAAAPAPRVVQAPPPELLFRMALQNTTRQPIVQSSILTPRLELQYYGDGRNILVAIGTAEYLPRAFNGLCERPCGLAFRDPDNYFDLTGKAKIKWTTIVSGFHRARPLIKLADGTVLVGDQAHGSISDWQQSEVSISDVRWLRLDPVRGVTVGAGWVEHPDLSRVEEVGYFDVIPGSGTPLGGWVAVYAFELWGRPVSRTAR